VKKYIIDTNALISFLTDRNLEQQKKIAPLFESAAHLKTVILCHQHVLIELIYVMDRIYQVPKVEIAGLITDLMLMPGIEVVPEINFSIVFSFWPDPIPDFGDAVIASVAKMIKGSAVVTFDRKFNHHLKSLGLNTHLM